MKALLLLTALVLSAGVVHAKTPAGPADAAPPSEEQVVELFAFSMGALPAMQEACGHSPEQKKTLSQGLTTFKKQLLAKLSPKASGIYAKAEKQGQKMTAERVQQFSERELQEKCGEFDRKLPGLLEKLKTVSPKAS